MSVRAIATRRESLTRLHARPRVREARLPWRRRFADDRELVGLKLLLLAMLTLVAMAVEFRL